MGATGSSKNVSTRKVQKARVTKIVRAGIARESRMVRVPSSKTGRSSSSAKSAKLRT